MSDVKRYRCHTEYDDDGNPFGQMFESPIGDYVDADDFATLQAKYDAAVELLRDVSDSLSHLIHCAKHFASEEREAPTEAHNLHWAVDDAEGDLARIDVLTTPKE